MMSIQILFLLLFFWPITLPLTIIYLRFVLRLAEGKRLISLAAATVALPFLAYQSAWLYFHYAAIPAEISLAYPVSINSEDDGYCGTAVFKLSKETLAAIKEQGIDFFETATQPRHNKDLRVAYKKWEESPTPSEWESSEGSWLFCSSVSEDSYKKLFQKQRRLAPISLPAPKERW